MIIIYAKIREEYDEVLLKVLEKAKEARVKFNKDKCKFYQKLNIQVTNFQKEV